MSYQPTEFEKPNFFSVIPAKIKYDKNLSPMSRLLYGDIAALANREGYCWATNAYFASLYEVAISTVSNWIRELSEAGYIYSIVEDGYKRRLLLNCNFGNQENQNGDSKIENSDSKTYGGGTKKISKNESNSISDMTEIDLNNTSNNTSNNTLNITEKNSFKKPSLTEIKDYLLENNLDIDAEKFFYYYESNGWYVGRNKMKSWHAAVRTWLRNSNPPKKEPVAPSIKTNLMTDEELHTYYDQQRMRIAEGRI